jgi:tRNA threonylcarbamoyladenosine biosynthesis protein TsaE
MNKTIIYNLNDLPKIVAELKALMQTHRVFAFTGSLGAGKTTLVRSLLQACGVTGVISSPTFTYVNIYSAPSEQEAPPAAHPEPVEGLAKTEGLAQPINKFYHFDLYRIINLQEFIDAGFDEYLNDPHAYVFIEWPEVIMPLLKNNVCFISLEYLAEDQRSITTSGL